MCVLVYRCLHGTAAAYLSDSFHLAADVDAHRHLRSADALALLVPSTRCSTLGDRAFPVAAARAWNSLPLLVRQSPFITIFCDRLKTCVYVAK